MISLGKLLIVSSFAGLVTCLLVAGAVGLLHGIPLAFMEILPGDDTAELQKLPRDLMAAGIGGFLVGWLGGFASHLAGQRIGYAISTLLVAAAAMLTIYWTHPGLNVNIESGWLDYLESYRLTLLAALGSTAAIVVLGMMMKPFGGKKSGD